MNYISIMILPSVLALLVAVILEQTGLVKLQDQVSELQLDEMLPEGDVDPIFVTDVTTDDQYNRMSVLIGTEVVYQGKRYLVIGRHGSEQGCRLKLRGLEESLPCDESLFTGEVTSDSLQKQNNADTRQ